ncbi:MAG: Flp pilus assembly protein CpaB [Verrucomicrobiota bacterium]
MNKAFNILLIASVLVGIFAAFLIVRILKSYEANAVRVVDTSNQGEEVVVETRKVAFAKIDLEPGRQITQTLVDYKQMPEALIPEGAVEDIATLEGLLNIHFIPEGDLLMTPKFKTPEQFMRASLIIPEGKRLVTLPLDELRSNAFMVKNGDVVDIVYSAALLNSDGEDTGQSISRIFMQKVKVFDINLGEQAGERTGQEPEGASTRRRGVGGNVTFLVDPQEAEILLNANANATLTMILRRYDDEKLASTTGAIDSMILDMLSAEALIPEEEVDEEPEVAPVVAPSAPRRFY